jgi:xylulose-5-phosphate/fructose-6-phosphate phosphoketolase
MQEAASVNGKVDVLNEEELSRLDAYWWAANYLSVGQIYLLDNPLLRDPLRSRAASLAWIPPAF